MVSGHWQPRWVDDAYLDMLEEEGQEVADLHRALLPLDEMDLGADSVLASISPYSSTVTVGVPARFTVTVRNPTREECAATIRLVLPVVLETPMDEAVVSLPAAGTVRVAFDVVARGPAARRRPFAADVSIGDLHLGQHAEAVVDVVVAPADA